MLKLLKPGLYISSLRKDDYTICHQSHQRWPAWKINWPWDSTPLCTRASPLFHFKQLTWVPKWGPTFRLNIVQAPLVFVMASGYRIWLKCSFGHGTTPELKDERRRVGLLKDRQSCNHLFCSSRTIATKVKQNSRVLFPKIYSDCHLQLPLFVYPVPKSYRVMNNGKRLLSVVQARVDSEAF